MYIMYASRSKYRILQDACFCLGRPQRCTRDDLPLAWWAHRHLPLALMVGAQTPPSRMDGGRTDTSLSHGGRRDRAMCAHVRSNNRVGRDSNARHPRAWQELAPT